ncbi:hypothetical protein, partial [Actinoplanes sp. M2I2]|uniref:hypothetical protein n=1 Tax=Actinoplanes sp. M2I2 TaxID=1734444 RepID=UPI002021A01F
LALGTGPHAANDVAVDRNGNAYVTDTFGGTVFKIDTAGKVTGKFHSPLFATTSSGVNGIVVHPNGYLLVGKYDSGQVLRVGLDGSGIRPVELDQLAPGADGLVLRRDGSLAIVTNTLNNPAGTSAVKVLRSSDGWRTATTTRLVPWPDPTPTTAADTPRGLVVLDARLDLTITGDFSLDEFVLRRW